MSPGALVDDAIRATVLIALTGLGMLVYAFRARRQPGPDAYSIIIWAGGGAACLLVAALLFTAFELIDTVLEWLA